MPTRLLLEGPDIEELLARVRDEHGGHARIVSAEKIRTGGLAGFFAKQRFELAVELDDEDGYEDDDDVPGTAAPRPEPAEPTSVQDLIAMVEARESALSTTPDPTGSTAARAAATRGAAARTATSRAAAPEGTPRTKGTGGRNAKKAPTAANGSNSQNAAVRGAAAREAAAREAAAREAAARDAAARDADVRNAAAREAALAREADARDAGVAREAATREAALARDAIARDLAAAWDAGTPGADPREALARDALVRGVAAGDVAARDALARDAVARDALIRDVAATRDAVAVRSVVAAARVANGTHGSPTADPSTLPRLAGAAALAAAGAAAEAATNGAYPVAVAVTPAAPAVPGTLPGTGVAVGPATIPMLPAAYRTSAYPGLSRPAAELLALGVPEALAMRAIGPDRYAAVLAAVGSLPAAPPPPDAAGEILALVGDVPACTALGEALSELQYLDGARVLVAGPVPAGTGVPPARRILGPDDAARRAGKLRAGETPRVVAVAAPVDGRSAPWARSVLAALRPTATWALVDATRKIADTARHLVDLGHLDALAIHSAAITADPGSILTLALELGIPVGFLDGRPATPEEWASILCARMGEP